MKLQKGAATNGAFVIVPFVHDFLQIEDLVLRIGIIPQDTMPNLDLIDSISEVLISYNILHKNF